ncbi:MAG: hypothetical protein COW84_05055 [Gammaproteobacteria bacterium CG22_combo_CG10-13_8_21_14_all_40_8]|nr:MAG: hypothetical protein COW84_05055 [Gammaproteobacteria bacterium CG22_combo_CG10-13_8_21_14_all_40_8]
MTNKPIDKIKHHTGQWSKGYKRRLLTEFHKLWRSKSSGFYGLGYIATFIYFEVMAFFKEIIEFDFSFSGIIGQIITQLISFSIQTIINTVQAIIWPFTFIHYMSAVPGFLLLAAGYFIHAWVSKKWDLDELVRIKSVDMSEVESVLNYCFNESDSQDIKLTKTMQDAFNGKFNRIQPQALPKEWQALLEKAENHQLEEWRHYPRACLALLLLLKVFTTEDNKFTNSYADEVLKEALHLELEEELHWKMQVVIYGFWLKSDQEKNKVKAQNKIRKLRKHCEKDPKNQFKYFVNTLNIAL